MGRNRNIQRKVLASLTMLILWEIWKERTMRGFFFGHVSILPSIITARIKEEATIWSHAGPKQLSYLMPGE